MIFNHCPYVSMLHVRPFKVKGSTSWPGETEIHVEGRVNADIIGCSLVLKGIKPSLSLLPCHRVHTMFTMMNTLTVTYLWLTGPHLCQIRPRFLSVCLPVCIHVCMGLSAVQTHLTWRCSARVPWTRSRPSRSRPPVHTQQWYPLHDRGTICHHPGNVWLITLKTHAVPGPLIHYTSALITLPLPLSSPLFSSPLLSSLLN